MLDAGYLMLDSGFLILDACYWMLVIEQSLVNFSFKPFLHHSRIHAFSSITH